MIVKLVYKVGSGDILSEELLKLQKENEGLVVQTYDAGYYKSKKDAIQIKASCGAGLVPFCAIYNDDKELVKAFYSEVGECTFVNISKYIKTWLKY
jgi:hypothetical protein